MDGESTDASLTDVEYHSPAHIVASSGAIMVLILLSLFGNILVCVAVYSSRTLQAHINYFIVSLAVSDILIAAISMPIWMTYEITKFKDFPFKTDVETLMKVWTFVDILGAVASIMNLAGISLERYLSVKSPLSHRRCMTNSWVAWGLLMIWIYAIGGAGIYILLWDWPWRTAYIATVGFFVPLLFIICSYVNVLHVIARSSRQVISGEEHRRVSVTVCVVIGAFVTCWLPFFALSLAGHYCTSCHTYIISHQWLRSLVKWMHYLNSCINPFIYGVFNAQYREAFKRLVKRICLRSPAKSPSPPVNPFRDVPEHHASSSSLFLPNIDDRTGNNVSESIVGAGCSSRRDAPRKLNNIYDDDGCSSLENAKFKEMLPLRRKESEPRYHPHPAFLRVDLGPDRSTAIMS